MTPEVRPHSIKSILFLFLLTFGLPPLAASENSQNASPVPVLVELFTSEGCSSCPPADALLQQLDHPQPVSRIRVIVLSEHVDYWNHDGWKDPYSSSIFSDRQSSYEPHFGVPGPYTPQMVVDGVSELNGSKADLAAHTIDEAARNHPKTVVRGFYAPGEGSKALRVRLSVDALPPACKASKANVYLVVALDYAQSHVHAGENNGRVLSHVAVAQKIEKVGVVEKGKDFARDWTLKLDAALDLSNLRVIAFVQVGDSGPVLGASLVGIQR